MRLYLALALGTTISLLPNAAAMAATVTYNISFVATWRAETHLGAYPSGAHFSPLIGAVHNDQVSFWVDGGLATPGIEQMAETGATTAMRSEIHTALSEFLKTTRRFHNRRGGKTVFRQTLKRLRTEAFQSVQYVEIPEVFDADPNRPHHVLRDLRHLNSYKFLLHFACIHCNTFLQTQQLA